MASVHPKPPHSCLSEFADFIYKGPSERPSGGCDRNHRSSIPLGKPPNLANSHCSLLPPRAARTFLIIGLIRSTSVGFFRNSIFPLDRPFRQHALNGWAIFFRPCQTLLPRSRVTQACDLPIIP